MNKRLGAAASSDERDPEKLCTYVRRDEAGNEVPCGNFRGRDLVEGDPGFGRCAWHGGRLSGKAKLAREGQEILRFWDPDAKPVEDVGDALLDLAGRLTATQHFLGAELERQMDRYQEAVDHWEEMKNAGEEECVCCGHNPKFSKMPKPPLGSATAHTWQFVIRELSALLTKIQALGLAERQIEFQEQTAMAIVRIMSGAVAKAGIDDVTAEVVRGEVLRGLHALGGPDPRKGRVILPKPGEGMLDPEEDVL